VKKGPINYDSILEADQPFLNDLEASSKNIFNKVFRKTNFVFPIHSDYYC
jgi:hypothetical protein